MVLPGENSSPRALYLAFFSYSFSEKTIRQERFLFQKRAGQRNKQTEKRYDAALPVKASCSARFFTDIVTSLKEKAKIKNPSEIR